jgi:hypothetical protein
MDEHVVVGALGYILSHNVVPDDALGNLGVEKGRIR